ncbi:hypothetical protein GCM10010182_00100 [Actinomadura cremea]|nr:hypothetical protein GCM10010182_00100 [Actinomadura cremea]
MTGKSRPDLYDLLRLNFGNATVEPGKLPEPDRRGGRSGDAKAAPPRRASGRSGPVSVRRADPRTWKVAQEVVDGDTRRLEVLADGSVFIHNHPIR